jgi:hypothetical protein
VALAAVCWWWLPTISVALPPYIPIIGFVLILIATLLSMAAGQPPEGTDESPDIAGRIDEGPGPWDRTDHEP